MIDDFESNEPKQVKQKGKSAKAMEKESWYANLNRCHCFNFDFFLEIDFKDLIFQRVLERLEMNFWR